MYGWGIEVLEGLHYGGGFSIKAKASQYCEEGRVKQRVRSIVKREEVVAAVKQSVCITVNRAEVVAAVKQRVCITVKRGQVVAAVKRIKVIE